MNHILKVNRFYPQAQDLRQHFESRFAEPKSNHEGRFVWDYWHVPDQYTLMRTPAYYYFPQKMYQNFHRYLVEWGQKNLGCHNISAPWLSYYVDGCKQELHSDVPHGPWAFVFSISPQKIKYQGGETLILKPQVLNYWQNFVEETDREVNSFIDRVASPFNQLTVFDPRYPHGVTQVKGVQDPREGRVVIHGWFVEPRPYVVGPLKVNQVQKPISHALQSLQEILQQVGDVHGTMSLRLSVLPTGEVAQLKWLTNTVVGLEVGDQQIRMLKKLIEKLFMQLKFTKAKGNSEITIPLLFK